jgi:hypothetical protein
MPHLGEWTQDDDDEENDNDDDDDDKEENDNEEEDDDDEESGEKLETYLEQAHRMFDCGPGPLRKETLTTPSFWPSALSRAGECSFLSVVDFTLSLTQVCIQMDCWT